MVEINIHKAQESLKEIVKTIKDSNSKEVTVDPLTGTFMKDGFETQGMKTYDEDRVRHINRFQAFDLGFCSVYIDPSLKENKIIFSDGNICEIIFTEKLM